MRRNRRRAVAASAVAVLCMLLLRGSWFSARARARPAVPVAAAFHREDAAQPGRARGIAAPDSARLELYDLADGTPARGFELVLLLKNGQRVNISTDAQGAVRVGAVRRVEAADSRWHVVRGAGRTLWVWRTLRVRITVRGAGAKLNPSSVALAGRYGGPRADGGRYSPDPWSPRWLRAHDIPNRVVLGVPDPTGMAYVTIPRIRGFGVLAKAPGWRTAWCIPEFDAATEEVAADLVLTRATRVGGVVRGPDGAPLLGARVLAYTVRQGRFLDFDLSGVTVELSDGFTGHWLEQEDFARVTAISKAVTDAQGRFNLALRSEGEVWIVVRAPGLTPHDRALGRLEEDRDGIEIALEEPADTTALLLLDGGKPVVNRRLLFTDLSASIVQPAFQLKTDARGRTPKEWFVAGRRYAVVLVRDNPAEARRMGFFFWSDQTILDFDRMQKHLAE